MILTPLQKLPNNVGNLGKIIVATGFEWSPKVQKIAHLVTLYTTYLFSSIFGASLKLETVKSDDGNHMPVLPRVANAVGKNNAAVTLHVTDQL